MLVKSDIVLAKSVSALYAEITQYIISLNECPFFQNLAYIALFPFKKLKLSESLNH